MGRVASFVMEMADADAAAGGGPARAACARSSSRRRTTCAGAGAAGADVPARPGRWPAAPRARTGEDDMWQVVQQVFAQAWQQFTAQSLALLPNVLVGLLFLAIGTALAVLAGRVAKFLLRRSAVERRANKIGLSSWLERAGILSATAVLVRLVQVVFAIMTAALVHVLAGCRARIRPDQAVLPLPSEPRGWRHDLLRRHPGGPRRVAQRADWRRQPRPRRPPGFWPHSRAAGSCSCRARWPWSTWASAARLSPPRCSSSWPA